MTPETMHRAHPWHGIDLGEKAPDEVTAFIEIVPTDTVKYEVDKKSGYLSLDRPQKFSNIVPSLYGFLPRTYCNTRMAEMTNQVLARYDIEGDGDPLDICVLTEKDVTHGDIIVRAHPIGGLRLLDHNQADDKIIAVLRDDARRCRIWQLHRHRPAPQRHHQKADTLFHDLQGHTGREHQENGVRQPVRGCRSQRDYPQVPGRLRGIHQESLTPPCRASEHRDRVYAQLSCHPRPNWHADRRTTSHPASRPVRDR